MKRNQPAKALEVTTHMYADYLIQHARSAEDTAKAYDILIEGFVESLRLQEIQTQAGGPTSGDYDLRPSDNSFAPLSFLGVALSAAQSLQDTEHLKDAESYLHTITEKREEQAAAAQARWQTGSVNQEDIRVAGDILMEKQKKTKKEGAPAQTEEEQLNEVIGVLAASKFPREIAKKLARILILGEEEDV